MRATQRRRAAEIHKKAERTSETKILNDEMIVSNFSHFTVFASVGGTLHGVRSDSVHTRAHTDTHSHTLSETEWKALHSSAARTKTNTNYYEMILLSVLPTLVRFLSLALFLVSGLPEKKMNASSLVTIVVSHK